jgi:xylose isomerase
VLAVALERAAVLIENDQLAALKAQRYAGWDTEFGRSILAGGYTLESLGQEAIARKFDPQHQSGQQERLENIVNAAIFG